MDRNPVKLWVCTGCPGEIKPIVFGWNNRYQLGRPVLCAVCNSIRKRKEAQEKPKPVAAPRKPIAKRSDAPPKPRKPISKQSEKQKAKNAKTRTFNAQIWATRPHVCFETGQPLGGKLRGIFFSHVHSKGAREDLRFDERNVVLHSPVAHDTWEFGDRSTMPKTMKVFLELSKQG